MQARIAAAAVGVSVSRQARKINKKKKKKNTKPKTKQRLRPATEEGTAECKVWCSKGLCCSSREALGEEREREASCREDNV